MQSVKKSKAYINDKQIGRRPEVMECLEAWLRCVENDPSRVAPKRLRSNAVRIPEGKVADPWDEYCRERVQETVDAIGSPTQADLLLDIAAHRVATGTIAGWKCFSVIAISPAATRKEAKMIQVPGSMPRLSPAQESGMELYLLAQNSFYWFRSNLQDAINKAEPYCVPPEDQAQDEIENKPITSQTW